MLKYVSLNRVDDTLTINLSDQSNVIGVPLFIRELQRILEANKGIKKLVFNGADFKPALITYWVNYVYKHFKGIELQWDSQLDTVPSCLPLQKMNYIKLQDKLYKRDLDSKYKAFEKAWNLK